MKKGFLKKEFEGSSPPAVFIGSGLRYPFVSVGVVSLSQISDNVWLYNSPNYWSKEGVPFEKIVEFRRSLVNSRIKSKVSDIRKASLSCMNKSTRILRTIQEIGMASLRADIEVKLNKGPKPRLEFNRYLMPLGPVGQLKQLRITSNLKIPPVVDRVYEDKDLKSAEAIKYLYKKGIKDEHYLKQILSIGITGLAKNRKLVPTRNSITAVDDLLGKHLLEKIRDYKIIENYEFYFGGHFGNYYLVLFFPDIFGYELFEMSVLDKGNKYTTDYENFRGRKSYAKETEGGYYAARISVIEHLEKIKKQASVLLLRFILPQYKAPLGVWVCRNSVRKALSENPLVFDSREELMKYTENFVKKTFKFSIQQILRKSRLLGEINSQKKLNSYF